VKMGGDGDGSGSLPFMYICISGVEFWGSAMLMYG
jgi:hypothetical protein